MRYVNIFCSSRSVVLCLISSAYCNTQNQWVSISLDVGGLPGLAGAHLGGEDGLPSLRDHVELLDGGGQVARRSQVGQAHEAALGPHVIVGPVVPLVGGVRGCVREGSGEVKASTSAASGNMCERFLQLHQTRVRVKLCSALIQVHYGSS